MALTKKETVDVTINLFATDTITIHIVGTSPMLMNRMPKKAMEQLLLGSRRDKSQIKHDMPAEFTNSMYRCEDLATAICFPGGAIKDAIGTVTADIPNVTRASVNRLISIVQSQVPIFGIPLMHSSVVRQAGPGRTPDIRTRAIFPRWCTVFDVRYVRPGMDMATVVTLIANAGMTVGIGDFRQEKGAGSYGCWRIAQEDDEEMLEIMADERKEEQLAAIEAATPYDDVTRELLLAFHNEVLRRASPAPKKARAKTKKAKDGESDDQEIEAA